MELVTDDKKSHIGKTVEMNRAWEQTHSLSPILLINVFININSNSGRGQQIWSSPNRPDRPWGPPSLLFNG